MSRWGRAKQMYGLSFRVLRQYKTLAVFPVLSGLASLAVLASFLPIMISSGHDGSRLTTVGYGLLALMYALLSFVTIFCNAALIHAADQALQGTRPTVGSSIAAMAARLPTIITWSLIAATVSVALRAVENRLGMFGKIIGVAFGLAWTLVAYLVLPILVLESISAPAALRRSKDLFKQTWGENAAGRVQLSLVTLILVLIPFPVFTVALIAALAIDNSILIVTVAISFAVLAVLWWLTVTVTGGAISAIFQTALYRYAADGRIAPGFTSADLPRAF